MSENNIPQNIEEFIQLMINHQGSIIKISPNNYKKSTSSKKQHIRFSADIDKYGITPYYLQNKGKGGNFLDNLVLFRKLFAEYAGVSVSEVDVDLDYNHSYYDSIDQYIEFTCSRDETDEEFEARKHLIANAKKVQREAAQKAKETKLEQERLEYERLRKKFGDA